MYYYYSNFVMLDDLNGYNWATVDVTTPKYFLIWKTSETTETKGIYKKTGYSYWRWCDTGEFVPTAVENLVEEDFMARMREESLADFKKAYESSMQGRQP